MLTLFTCGLFLLSPTAGAVTEVDGPYDGQWRAWLESPGGKLRFGLEIETTDDGTQAWIINGEERVRVPRAEITDGRLLLRFVHYSSAIQAHRWNDGVLRGQWLYHAGSETIRFLPLTASPVDESKADRSGAGAIDKRINGRWAVDFSGSDDPAVGVFEVDDQGVATGTFLTTLGDYRYLGGSFQNGELELSCFDGAHAFLFKAALLPDGSLKGDFWSRDAWHETWAAVRDDDAALPDAWGLTAWNDDEGLDALVFQDLDGNAVSPADDRFTGRARIIEVFGTWCPNCNDATKFLSELHHRYSSKGLSILGLAFEITGNEERDRGQIRKYIDHHGIKHPILLAGISDKAEATKAFPMLDRVRSYPTFIFLDADDNVRGIYTGYSGPATGAEHQKLRESFERLIEQLLAE